MTERLHDDARVDALREQERRARVSEIVERLPWQTRRLELLMARPEWRGVSEVTTRPARSVVAEEVVMSRIVVIDRATVERLGITWNSENEPARRLAEDAITD